MSDPQTPTAPAHTKGPWVKDRDNIVWCSPGPESGVEIADCSANGFDARQPNEQSATANAALIASAPRLLQERDMLLAMLKTILAAHDTDGAATNGKASLSHNIAERARAAIAAVSKGDLLSPVMDTDEGPQP